MPEYACPAKREDGHCRHHGCSGCCLLCKRDCTLRRFCNARGYAEWVKHVDSLQPHTEEGER